MKAPEPFPVALTVLGIIVVLLLIMEGYVNGYNRGLEDICTRVGGVSIEYSCVNPQALVLPPKQT